MIKQILRNFNNYLYTQINSIKKQVQAKGTRVNKVLLYIGIARIYEDYFKIAC